MALIEVHIHHDSELEKRFMALEQQLEEQGAALKANFEELKQKIGIIPEAISAESRQAQERFDIQDAIIRRLETKVEELTSAAPGEQSQTLAAQVTAEIENLRQISDEMKGLVPNLDSLAEGIAGIIPDVAPTEPPTAELTPAEPPVEPLVTEPPIPMPVPEGIDPITGFPIES
jgi:chromosome segregation ATPase